MDKRNSVEVLALKRDRSKDPPRSAAELMAELRADPQYVAQMRERNERQIESAESYRNAAAPLLRELAASGFLVQSLGELRRGATDYSRAIPILVRWLPQIEDPRAKEDLVRSLSVPWAGPAALRSLIDEFKRTDDQHNGLRWAIANAIAVTGNDAEFDELVALATDAKYGKSREMLTLALGNCRDPRAVDVLISLLADEQVIGHAVMALGKLKSKVARSHINKFVDHPTEWIRSEANRALVEIDGPPSAAQ